MLFDFKLVFRISKQIRHEMTLHDNINYEHVGKS